MKPLLEIKNLNINYKNSIKAVKNVSLTLEDNQIISIVGESGSGKSTLIRAILKLLPTGGEIESGNIFFLEKDILTLNKKQLNKLATTFDVKEREKITKEASQIIIDEGYGTYIVSQANVNVSNNKVENMHNSPIDYYFLIVDTKINK